MNRIPVPVPGRSATDIRFREGQSGNPGGKPRSQPKSQPSAFDIIIDRTLTIVQAGKAREVTNDEALQHIRQREIRRYPRHLRFAQQERFTQLQPPQSEALNQKAN